MQTETVRLTPVQAEKLRRTLEFSNGRATFDGRTVTDHGDGTFSVCGDAGTVALFTRLVRGIQTGEDRAASEKQIAYLKRLIVRDPAAAMAVGASPDGVRVTPGLGMRAASRMIGQLQGGV